MLHQHIKAVKEKISRGFEAKKMEPKKTQAELDAEKALRDFEAGKYGGKAPEPKPEPKEEQKPAPKPKPDELDEDIAADIKRRSMFKRLAPVGK